MYVICLNASKDVNNKQLHAIQAELDDVCLCYIDFILRKSIRELELVWVFLHTRAYRVGCDSLPPPPPLSLNLRLAKYMYM